MAEIEALALLAVTYDRDRNDVAAVYYYGRAANALLSLKKTPEIRQKAIEYIERAETLKGECFFERI